MKLYWLDLETTGLDPVKDDILEIAVAEADFKDPFNIKFIFDVVLFYPYLCSTETESISDYVIQMHTKNGLWADCVQSHATVKQADAALSALMEGDDNIFAGSSIHFDASFIKAQMPLTFAKFTQRHFDVSAIKLLGHSQGMPQFPKAEAHRARADILESVDHAKQCLSWLTFGGALV